MSFVAGSHDGGKMAEVFIFVHDLRQRQVWEGARDGTALGRSEIMVGVKQGAFRIQA